MLQLSTSELPAGTECSGQPLNQCPPVLRRKVRVRMGGKVNCWRHFTFLHRFHDLVRLLGTVPL